MGNHYRQRYTKCFRHTNRTPHWDFVSAMTFLKMDFDREGIKKHCIDLKPVVFPFLDSMNRKFQLAIV